MKVALFSTCLVDQFFPKVGTATLRVLKKCGVSADYPRGQTCCGQPFHNMGYREEARRLARRTIETLRPYDAVVIPSGSCAAMIRVHYPELFAPEESWHREARALAAKTYELSQFLVHVLLVTKVETTFNGTVTYHDGCHLLRELRVRGEPRELIRGVRGCSLVEMKSCDSCCGFGGTFSVKFPEVSSEMAKDKIDAIRESGARTVVAGDSSCLMQIAGALKRRGVDVQTMHLAELLAR